MRSSAATIPLPGTLRTGGKFMRTTLIRTTLIRMTGRWGVPLCVASPSVPRQNAAGAGTAAAIRSLENAWVVGQVPNGINTHQPKLRKLHSAGAAGLAILPIFQRTAGLLLSFFVT